MSLLAAAKKPAVLKKWAFVYLLCSLFCVLFGAVYEYFSHDVYSNFMIYAFVIPLVGGTLVSFLLDFFSQKTMPGRVSFNLYNSGIAALTVGSVFQGVLDIYGTTNALISVYWAAGFGFVAAGGLAYAAGVVCRPRN